MLLYPSLSNEFLGSSTVVRAILLAVAKTIEDDDLRVARSRRFAILRQRRTVHQIHGCLGARYFCLAYRMSFDSFWTLHANLLPHIVTASRGMRSYRKVGGRVGGNYVLPPIPNGEITTSVRLACALRYFAGGCPYDIAPLYGVAISEVHLSVWVIVYAINSCDQFAISYPESLEEQRKIARGFQNASTPGIPNCAGAIDGILIWTLKPSLKDANKSGIGQKKFLCGRKNKFGLNCQAVSDCRGHILDISINYGGSSSDCIAFEGSDLYHRLQNGLMKKDGNKPRFVLFGDNAYLNSSFMATPYPNVSGDPNKKTKDDYNFYHSQLRESNVHLACLYNDMSDDVPLSLNTDENFIMNDTNGYVELTGDDDHDINVPIDLMHVGHHFDDVPRNVLVQHRYTLDQCEDVLPREELHNFVASGHWARPSLHRGK
eukprot:CCRYP_020044-RA/>CCRYP_020044-RA protein AED:0.32 eAED:-0.07 QI:0/0/0/1/1/1/2/0/430